jgi:hypothetical protein
MTRINCDSIEDHEKLLAEKGWLEPEMGGIRVGSWLRDFRERFVQTRTQAMISARKAAFFMPAIGRFNEGLDQVFFHLRYQYDPRKKTLSLLTVQARLGKTCKTYLLNGYKAPPTPTEVYNVLQRREGPDRLDKLFARIGREQHQETHPTFDPYLDMTHPRFNQVNDLNKDTEYPDHPPNDLSRFVSRPLRRGP